MTGSSTPRAKRARPDFALETAARAQLGPNALVAGIDEVGRGPLAGPVVAAAAVLSDEAAVDLEEAGLDDSKRLSAKRRAGLAHQIGALEADAALSVALGAASVREIDDLGIGRATERAMARALERLTQILGGAPALALVDGKHAPRLPVPVKMVIGGDGRSLSIAAAALLAKVTRDRAMARLDARHPAFGWASNVGYGAARHRDAIRVHGMTAHHRALFCRRVLAEAAAPVSTAIASRR